jgi:hypothetical protein
MNHPVQNVIRPFICEYCEKTYSSKAYKNRHIKLVHSEIRPFPCDKCEYSAKTPYLIKKTH